MSGSSSVVEHYLAKVGVAGSSPVYRLLILKGKSFEILAENYLKSKKYKILSKNFRSPFGEIDILAIKDNCLIAVEVKGGILPFEKVTKSKIQKITKTLQFFIRQNKLSFETIRLDAIFIFKVNSNDYQIYHIENITL